MTMPLGKQTRFFFVDRMENIAVIIDVTIPRDKGIIDKKKRKIEKYQNLKRQIERLWNLKKIGLILWSWGLLGVSQ